VNGVQRPEEEERFSDRVLLDNFCHAVLEQLILEMAANGVVCVATMAVQQFGSWLSRIWRVRIVLPQIILIATLVCCHFEAPVVGLLIEVDKAGIITSACWGVFRSGHADVPFADHVGSVATLAHDVPEASHISWNTREASNRIFWIAPRVQAIVDVDVNWCAPRLNGTPGRTAHLVGVVATQNQAVRRQKIDVVSIRPANSGIWLNIRITIEGWVGKAQVVHEDEQDVRLVICG